MSDQPSYPPSPAGPSGSYPPPGPPGYTPPPPGPSGPPGYNPPPPGPQGYVPPPPMTAPPRRRNWLGPVILVVIVAVIGVGFFVFRDQLSGNVNDLKVGDCIDEPVITTSVSDVQHQPCNQPHDAEVFTVVTDTTSGDYPGDSHFSDLANSQCTDAASSYLGTDFNSRDDIGGGFFYPSTDSWANGDRTITCYLDRTDGQQLTASLHNLGSAPLPGP
jgi:Septum formation